VAELDRFNRNAIAWLCLVSALAIHVFDEATTGFLSFYNDTILGLRETLSFFRAPTFTFSSWITGLTIALAMGFALTWQVSRGGKFIRVLTIAVAVLMLGNALGHLLGSAYLGRILPGFRSSFLLLPAALWMLWRGFVGDWGHRRRVTSESA